MAHAWTALLADAERTDQAEDNKFDKNRRGDELPEALARRETRLAKIREAKAALADDARQRARKHTEAGPKPKP